MAKGKRSQVLRDPETGTNAAMRVSLPIVPVPDRDRLGDTRLYDTILELKTAIKTAFSSVKKCDRLSFFVQQIRTASSSGFAYFAAVAVADSCLEEGEKKRLMNHFI